MRIHLTQKTAGRQSLAALRNSRDELVRMTGAFLIGLTVLVGLAVAVSPEPEAPPRALPHSAPAR